MVFGGDTLCTMHGCGVAQFGSRGHVGGGQGDDPAVPNMPQPQPTGPDQAEDGPPVTVFHPVGCRCTQYAVVGPGDDQVADARGVAVGQLNLPARRTAGETVVAGALVEGADQLTGRRQHDRIKAVVAVGPPGVEDVVEGGGWVADVDASPVQVEAERFGSAVAERECGGGLGRVGEPVQLGEPEGAVAGLDVAEHPAGRRLQRVVDHHRPAGCCRRDRSRTGRQCPR